MRTHALRVVFLLAGLELLVGAMPAPGSGQDPETFQSRCGAGVHVDERSGWIWLPQGQIFCPLAADPKSERSFLSYLRGDFATLADPEAATETNIGAAALGDDFAVFRLAGSRSGDGLQLSLAGAVFAQFNLDQPSFDLINTDFLVGLPLTARRGDFSARLRVYHQSSHLGDELLLARQPERINLSFESAELVLSGEVGPARLYAGGETFFRREPDDLPPHLVHAGAELRPATIGDGRLLAAVDLKAVENAEWDLGWSARAGIEVARVASPGHPPRIVSVTAEFYDGPAPYGQFYREDIRYWGVGLTLTR